ncbi:MAG: phage holin family protein [Psychrobacillus sp.]
MLNELKLYREEVLDYMANAWLTVNPYLIWFGGIFSYICFPTESYKTYAMITLGLLILDLATKYYAIAKKSGGFMQAIRTKALSSHKMWIGTRRKLLSYMIVIVLVGLIYRFEQLQDVAGLIGTLSYCIMFLREAQSVLEKMVQAGHKDLSPWLLWTRRKTESLEAMLENAEEAIATNATIEEVVEEVHEEKGQG